MSIIEWNAENLFHLVATRTADSKISRAGIVPYIAHGWNMREWEVMVRKRNPAYDNSRFEISKGKRQVLGDDGHWRDVRKEEDLAVHPKERREPLFRTALREGRQEIGLLPENITSFADAGDYQTSGPNATRNDMTLMRIFAVSVKDRDNFAPFGSETMQGQWMKVSDFLRKGPRAHAEVVTDVLKGVMRAMREGKLPPPGAEKSRDRSWNR
jgi:hypothetical protein